MSAGKNLLRRIVSAVVEPTYNAGGTPVYPGDAFHVHEDFEVEEQYQFDGKRSGTAAGASMQTQDGKSGRFCDLDLAHRVRPGGAAYSASVKPTVDRMLRAHGMTATLNAGVGVEKYTYAPFTDGTWESLYGELYVGKDKFAYQGGYVRKWTHVADGLGVPIWTFSLKACLAARVVDWPSPGLVSYPNAGVLPPRAAGSVLTIAAAGGTGAFQGLVRKSTVTSDRTIDDRMSQAAPVMASDASGHAGFQLGRFTETMDVVVEAPATRPASYNTTALLDPERMAEEATLCTVVLGFNQGIQYNRYKFLSSASAQIIEAKKDKAGAIRLWNLTIALNPTSEVADDGLSVVFD